MLSSDRRACVTVALIALGGFAAAAAAPAHARGEEPREHHESRPSEARRAGAARQSHRVQAARVEAVHADAARTQAARAAVARPGVRGDSYARARPVIAAHREVLARGIHPHEVHPALADAHVVRYGGALSGSVEHALRPGFVSRTFVSGGHVLYTHVYQQHVWHQFGRAFAYETYVPPVRFPAAYYGWALGVWPHPVRYAWSWQVQPWYPAYGALFTPYPVYTSPDLWMTDYILAQNMQAAYQAQAAQAQAAAASYAYPAAAPDSQSAPSTYVDPAAAPDSQSAPSTYVDPAAAPGAVAPQSDYPVPAPPGETPAAPAAPTAAPPAITPQIKAQLNEQIKVQLQEQQAAAAMPATLTTAAATAGSPPALRPNHVFFQVVQPLDVPSGANRHCTLSANDYIKRTGGIGNDDWMIPVVVELSGPTDCPEGLRTRIGLNDLNAMENEQEAQVLQAMRAASKSMGPNGPPSGAGPQPSLIADGSAPDPGALEALRQAQ